MTTRDIYGLVARIGGLVFWVFAAGDFIRVIAMLLRLPMQSQYSLTADAVGGVAWALLGTVLTFGAEWLTRLVYGKAQSR